MFEFLNPNLIYIILPSLLLLGAITGIVWVGRKSMWFLGGAITITMGLAIGSVAAYFSIYGLMALFSASAISVAVMAATLESGKFVLAAVLHYFWSKLQRLLRWTMATQLAVLMLITSIGIFGFLTQAHLKHEGTTAEHVAKIEMLVAQTRREQNKIDSWEKQIADLREGIFGVMEKGFVTSGIKAQPVIEKKINEIEQLITDSRSKIDGYEAERLRIEAEKAVIDREIGPLKYVAALIWDSTDSEATDRAVRMMVVLIMFVFDPLAVLMFVAGTMLFHQGLVSYKAKQARKKKLVTRPTHLNKVKRTVPKARVTTMDETSVKVSPTKSRLTAAKLRPGRSLTKPETNIINVATTEDGKSWGRTRLSVYREGKLQ